MRYQNINLVFSSSLLPYLSTLQSEVIILSRGEVRLLEQGIQGERNYSIIIFDSQTKIWRFKGEVLRGIGQRADNLFKGESRPNACSSPWQYQETCPHRWDCPLPFLWAHHLAPGWEATTPSHCCLQFTHWSFNKRAIPSPLPTPCRETWMSSHGHWPKGGPTSEDIEKQVLSIC